MIRSTLLLSAALLACPLAALAQAPDLGPISNSAPLASPPPSQLDRIEHKLDEVIQRLNKPPTLLPEAAGGRGTFSEAPTSPHAASGPPAASLAAYKPGGLAIVHPGPKDTATVSEIPSDSVGGFIYEGGSIVLTDIRARGVRYAGHVGVEIQGWLKAKDAGRYQIATDIMARFTNPSVLAPTCFLQAWLEGRSLDQRTTPVSNLGKPEATASLVVGADLQPGLYRVRIWTNCTAPQGVTTASELLIKTPTELNLRPVTGNDLLHREE